MDNTLDKLKEDISKLSVYGKQELIVDLTSEIHNNYNEMLCHLENIDGHVFGMQNNSEQNNLNDLTLTQLDRIKKLSSQVSKYN